MNILFEDRHGPPGTADEHRPDCAVLHNGFFCSCDLRARREAAQEVVLAAARVENARLWKIQREKDARELRRRRFRRFLFKKTPFNALLVLGLWYIGWLMLPVIGLYVLFGSAAWGMTIMDWPTEPGDPHYRGGLGYLRFFVLW